MDGEGTAGGGPGIPVSSLFLTPDDEVRTALRRIKGTHRRRAVEQQLAAGEQVETWMLLEDLPEPMRAVFGARAPELRSGEDLPDLEDGEVEIARLRLTRSIHQEVTSLRAAPAGEGATLRLVDEYEEEAELPFDRIDGELTIQQVVDLFVLADPSPVEFGPFEVMSDFFADLDRAFDGHRQE